MNLKGLVDDCADISDKSTQQSKQQLVSITTEAHAEYWPSKNSNQSTGKHDNNSNGFIKKRESVHKNINEPKY